MTPFSRGNEIINMATNLPEPIPTIDFHITDNCNYRCLYCCEGKVKGGNASDEVIDAFIKLLKILDGVWEVQLIGGEVFLHPRFFELCEHIVKTGYKINITTNFSYPVEKFEKLAGICKENLTLVMASLHLSQVRSLDEFIEKADRFNKIKSHNTEFLITSVVTEENFDFLLQIKERLYKLGLRLHFQPLKIDRKFVKYSPKIENFFKNAVENKLTGLSGTICYTGYKYFHIRPNGDVRRCYDKQPDFFLGNIKEGTFKPFDCPKPCLSDKCTCSAPFIKHMIRLGESRKF